MENLHDLLGKKIQIKFTDIASNFYNTITITVFVGMVSESSNGTTVEIKVFLQDEEKRDYKIPPFIFIGIKKGISEEPKVFLPWVNTNNPNDSFVPCTFEVIK